MVTAFHLNKQPVVPPQHLSSPTFFLPNICPPQHLVDLPTYWFYLLEQHSSATNTTSSWNLINDFQLPIFHTQFFCRLNCANFIAFFEVQSPLTENWSSSSLCWLCSSNSFYLLSIAALVSSLKTSASIFALLLEEPNDGFEHGLLPSIPRIKPEFFGEKSFFWSKRTLTLVMFGLPSTAALNSCCSTVVGTLFCVVCPLFA